MATKQSVECDEFQQACHKVQAVYPCGQCGGQHRSRECPAYGQQCGICHKYNHFAKVCRSKLKHKSQSSAKKKVDVVKDKELGSNSSDSDAKVFSLDPIQIHGLAEHSAWYSTISTDKGTLLSNLTQEPKQVCYQPKFFTR